MYSVANESWPTGEQFAGVSSFGFGGTNAHAILRIARRSVATVTAFDPPDVLCLSARDRVALNEAARRYADFLSETDLPLADICFTALSGRSRFPYRLSVVAHNGTAMEAALRAFAAGEELEGVSLAMRRANGSGPAMLDGLRVTGARP